ncbi:MAG: glycosyltransferase [Gemmatimonadetes bacterium]|nr:glycosyltransferase [Gemmatimonadota bacterium]
MNEQLVGVLAGTTALAVYTYAGYPAILEIAGRRRVARRPAPEVTDWPSVSIVIPAYNEAAVIGRTLTRLLQADYPPDRRQIIVISDASTDGTDDIVRSFAERGVELMRMNTRGGKTRNENAVIPLLRGEIIMNTDAAMQIHPQAIKALVGAMADPTVGVASGRDVSVGSATDEGKNAEGAYVGYEMWVRDLETRLHGIVGASGCLYAIRADLHRHKVRDDLSRDFAAALTAREAGFRAVSVPEAICYVPRTSSLHREYHRKVRTIDRGLSTLGTRYYLLNPFRYGGFAWMLWSHKLCRWLLPWVMVVAMAALFRLALTETWARWLTAAGLATCLLAVIGWFWPEEKRLPKMLALPTFAVLGNVAVIHAWLRTLGGRGTPVWEPTRRPADSTTV